MNTATTPLHDQPVTHTEVYSVQANAKATDLHVLHLPDIGRYSINVSDGIYVYVDRDGLLSLADQIGRVLA